MCGFFEELLFELEMLFWDALMELRIQLGL